MRSAEPGQVPDASLATRTRAFFSATLAAVLITVANAQGCARAERLANAVDPAQLAGEIDVAALPLTTADGRVVPRSRRAQLENALQKLYDRGELPPCPEVSFATLKLVAGCIAGLDNDGIGCWASSEALAKKTNRSPTTIRLVAGWLEKYEWGFNFSRVAADDRKIGDATYPVTGTKTTVRRLFPISAPLLAKLSDDEILDLIAFDEKKPVARLTSEPEPAPAAVAGPAPPPRPASAAGQPGDGKPGRVGAPSGASGGRAPAALGESAETAELAEVLRELAGLTGHEVTVAWFRENARNAGLEDLDHVTATARDLVKHIIDDQKNGRAAGKPGRRRLEARIEKYFAGTITFVASGGERARLAEEAKQREEAYRKAYKTPEQLERERGEAKRTDAPSARVGGPSLEMLGKLFVECEPDPGRKAALAAEVDAALTRIAAEPDPARRGALERVFRDTLQRAQAPPR